MGSGTEPARPLYHPSLKKMTVQGILHAYADEANESKR
jgi:hypothetical protein